MMVNVHPRTDGLDHIWVSANGRTELGRSLHIGAYRPFHHPRDGYFASIIAYWIWLDSGRVDGVRDLHHGNLLRTSLAGLVKNNGHRTQVRDAVLYSITENDKIAKQLQESHLPLYVYEYLNDGFQEMTYELADREWYVRELERIRRHLQAKNPLKA